ncbi:MAG: 30S ribosomal protein S17 [bacterium]
MEQAEAQEASRDNRGHRKVRTGVVVSDKMDKTVVVRLERTKLHARYKKYIRAWKRVKAHDKDNSCRVGDEVQLIESRPLSKSKRWRVHKVLRRAE